MVVYLNMTGCKLLCFIISEAAEQPQQLTGNQQEQGKAGSTDPTEVKPKAFDTGDEDPKLGGCLGLPHSSGEIQVSCVLLPFSRYPLLATIGGGVLK